jgi:hypothetical protein
MAKYIDKEARQHRGPRLQTRIDVKPIIAAAMVALATCVPAADGGPSPEPTGRIGVVQQALTNGISATPNPCMPAVGAQTCSTTVTWTEATPTKTYQVAVRSIGNASGTGPWRLFACVPPNGSLRSGVADFIIPNRPVEFSLRSKNNGTCTELDLAATEVASVTVQGTTAALTASPQLVVTPSTGSTTLNWAATYDLVNVAPYAASYALWVRVDDQVDGAGRPLYSVHSCIDDISNQGITATSTVPWILAGHKYRFSLNLHNDPNNTGIPGTCSNYTTFRPGCFATPPTACYPDGPEIAATTVTAVSNYITAGPSGILPNDILTQAPAVCSAPNGGTCQVTLNWGTSSSGVTPQIWEYNGSTWTKLPCPTASKPTRTLTSGLTYSYELHLPSSCNALRTSTPAVATATAKAVSGFLVRDGTQLKLDGASLRALGMSKWDLFAQYLQGSVGAAQTAMTDAANRGIKYLRVNGGAWDHMQTWRTSPTLYWTKFGSMLSDANTRNIKILLTITDDFCDFASHAGEDLRTMLTNPNSNSQQELFSYVNDLLTRYRANTDIQLWELGPEINFLVDQDYTGVISCSTSMVTTDEFVAFVRGYAAYVKNLDPNHVIGAGYADVTPNGAHLRAWPSAAGYNDPPGPCAGGSTRWCADDENMMDSFAKYMHPDPIDVFGLHFSNGTPNNYFGFGGAYNAEIIATYKRAADLTGKPVYDTDLIDCDGDWVATNSCALADPRMNFGRAALHKLVELHIPLSTRWVWQLGSTPSPDTNNLWPNAGYPLVDEYVNLYANVDATWDANTTLSTTTTGIDVTPPNPGFEFGSGIPAEWSVTTGNTSWVTREAATFNATAVKLTPQAGSLNLDSTAVALGTSVPSTAYVVASVAAATDGALGDARVCVYGYPNAAGTGSPSHTACIQVNGDTLDKFKVYFATFQGSPLSIRVRLMANGTGYAKFDDVRVSVIY